MHHTGSIKSENTGAVMRDPSSLQDTYALVTGASEGLGREFAFQLAALGMNLILVARNESKLNETAIQIRELTDRKVLVIPADLTDLAELQAIPKTLQQLSIHIKILVNNAGSGAWGHFENVSLEIDSKIIDLNLKAPILLSKLLFEDLRRSKDSAIINVSSMAAVQPVPFMSVYAATKSSLTSFSLALWKEWEKHGIYVQTLMPGAVDTGFDAKSGGFEAPFYKDSVSTIVKMSIDALLKNQKPVVYANGSTSQRLFAKFLPIRFLIHEVSKVFSPDIRK